GWAHAGCGPAGCRRRSARTSISGARRARTGQVARAIKALSGQVLLCILSEPIFHLRPCGRSTRVSDPMSDFNRGFSSIPAGRADMAVDAGLRSFMLGVYNKLALGLVVSGA